MAQIGQGTITLNDQSEENKIIWLTEDTPISRMQIIVTPSKEEIKKAFALTVVYYNKTGHSVYKTWNILFEHPMWDMVTEESEDFDSFLCNKIEFKYSEFDVKTSVENNSIKLKMSVYFLSEGERKRHTTTLNEMGKMREDILNNKDLGDNQQDALDQ